METVNRLTNSPPRISAEFQLLFAQPLIAAKLDISIQDREYFSSYIRQRQGEFRKHKRDGVVFEQSPIGLHNLPEFDPLFQRIGQLVNASLSKMGLSSSHLDLYILRSWANLSTKGMVTAEHSHLNSHISVVYYPDKSSTQATIKFQCGIEQSWVTGFNTLPYKRAGLHDATNPLSANYYSIDPQEDLCLIFPSSLVHSVSPNASVHPRISIAMDALFTLKQYTQDEPLLPPPSTWGLL